MELENHTPFPAGLFRTILDETRFAASILARVTYDISGDGLVPSAEQPWIVSFPPWENEYGPMDGDECFFKGGVDLLLFGHACAPRGRKVARMDVSIEVGGDFRRSVTVTGDRVWRKVHRKLVPGEPEPFERIPLTLANAFGGKQSWDGLETMYVDNPGGKGYYIDEENAVDHPLPNIEEPDQLISKWDDRPIPAGVGPCPAQCSLRFLNGVKLEEDGRYTVLPSLFNSAFPRMIRKGASPGERVKVSGVSPDGPIEFGIPDTDLSVRLRFDDWSVERRLAIDQIGIEADKKRAFIAYRHPFRYVLYPLQKRSCELFLNAGSPAGRR